MEKEVILKKATFGGFDRKEVMEYIGAIQEKLAKTEAKLGELKTMQERIYELEGIIEEKDAEISDLNETIEELENRIAEFEGVDEELEASMASADKSVTDFADAISSMSERISEASGRGDKKAINDWLRHISGTVGEIGAALDMLSAKAESSAPAEKAAAKREPKKVSATVEVSEDKEKQPSTVRRSAVKVKKPAEKTVNRQSQESEAPIRSKPNEEAPADDDTTSSGGEIDFSEDMIAQIREIEKKYRELVDNMPD